MRRVDVKRLCCLSLLLAWTLWIRTQGAAPESWTATTGFQNQQRCQNNMREKLDVWRQFKDAKFGRNSVTFTENKTTVTYYCLPDTEDPRRRTKRPGNAPEPEEPPTN
jgi:hypothetical protein